MTNYHDHADQVRVDFFRTTPEGVPRKWYATESVRWLTWSGDPQNGGKLLQDAFREALEAHLNGRLRGMVAFCGEPYHENACPVVMTVPS